ncbi:MAG: undecaprenyl diphosphate synthase family protein [archaeon]
MQLFNLKILQDMLQKRQQDKNNPRHIIVNLFPIKTTDETTIGDTQKLLSVLDMLIIFQKDNNIPIFTVSLGKAESFDQNILKNHIETILAKSMESKINVTVFGKWYDLSGLLVEELKRLNNETKDFDSYFLNICINYDGQEEVADACKIMVKKAMLEKLDIDKINSDVLKEHLYSSYFLPPDLIVETSGIFRGTFLWDTCGAVIYPILKPATDLTSQDIQKALDYWSNAKKA